MTIERYTLISADCHAGASHATYREYLDPAYRADFDAWREQYRNPFKDLKDNDLRIRNWDDDRGGSSRNRTAPSPRWCPRTVPPFFPSFVLSPVTGSTLRTSAPQSTSTDQPAG